MLYIHTYIYILYSSYEERIQRKQCAQYRKRRAITVKVTLTSARCAEVSVTLTMYYIYIKRKRVVERDGREIDGWIYG